MQKCTVSNQNHSFAINDDKGHSTSNEISSNSWLEK